jgi:hypothetical protein
MEAMNRMEEDGWVPTASTEADKNDIHIQKRLEETADKNFVIV